MKTYDQLLLSIRRWILFFIVALMISGVTAFALETELAWLEGIIPKNWPGLYSWINRVYEALSYINDQYPFLAYGYDWLAFAHLVIAIAFLGPLKDPVRNVWIIQFGIIACVLIFPLALVAGYIRQIPFYWQMIDCSFGVVGLVPLTICLRKIRKLEAMSSAVKLEAMIPAVKFNYTDETEEGACPKAFLKAKEKCEKSLNPTSR